ncbi:MAG: hypothetical protein EBT92_04835 [Planctomycetes bacterium]|nr:hypothetical protein [Planctomycetota bacterium]
MCGIVGGVVYQVQDSLSDLVKITNDGSFKSHLAWSPDGKKLLFTRIHQGKMELCTVKAEKSAEVVPLVVPSPNTPHFDGHWSADGKSIVYVHDILQGTDGKLQINEVLADGTGAKVLIPHKAFEESPRYSPDGKHIAWVSTRDGNQEIYSLELANQKVQRLTQDQGFDNNPNWKHDGSRIVYSSSRFGNFEICSMKNDGTGVLRLTNDLAMDVWPVYSPNGKAIAFTSNRTGSYNIFVMNEDGSGVRNITNNKSINNFAAWSPDGKMIAFISNFQGSYEVYIKSVLQGKLP